MTPFRENVPATVRKPLSPTQRARMFLAHDGKCCICRKKIIERSWIDEHINPLWNAGGNEPENRGPAHRACAQVKTNGEAPVRAKVNRLRKANGFDPIPAKPGRKIVSRGFDKSLSKRMDGTVVGR